MLLPARSPAECDLYLDLNPCRCGEFELTTPDPRVEPADGNPDGGLVATYEGSCSGCGVPRRFEFQLDPEPPPPPPAYGGDAPSRLIDPGQFLWVSEQYASTVPADPAELTDTEDRDDAIEALDVAIAALREVLKFIPPGGDAVPEEAFTAPDGWMLHQQEPGRFRRDRLHAVLRAYQESLAEYAG